MFERVFILINIRIQRAALKVCAETPRRYSSKEWENNLWVRSTLTYHFTHFIICVLESRQNILNQLITSTLSLPCENDGLLSRDTRCLSCQVTVAPLCINNNKIYECGY